MWKKKEFETFRIELLSCSLMGSVCKESILVCLVVTPLLDILSLLNYRNII